MVNLPTGTVTFLFTDIEGSTTRWEHQRVAMQAALARHDVILREAIEAHGGHVFKTVGDAFYAVVPMADSGDAGGNDRCMTVIAPMLRPTVQYGSSIKTCRTQDRSRCLYERNRHT